MWALSARPIALCFFLPPHYFSLLPFTFPLWLQMGEPQCGDNSYSFSPSQSCQCGEGDTITALDCHSFCGRQTQAGLDTRPTPCSLGPNPCEIEYSHRFSGRSTTTHCYFSPPGGYQVTGTDPQWLLVTLSLVTTCRPQRIDIV